MATENNIYTWTTFMFVDVNRKYDNHIIECIKNYANTNSVISMMPYKYSDMNNVENQTYLFVETFMKSNITIPLSFYTNSNQLLETLSRMNNRANNYLLFVDENNFHNFINIYKSYTGTSAPIFGDLNTLNGIWTNNEKLLVLYSSVLPRTFFFNMMWTYINYGSMC